MSGICGLLANQGRPVASEDVERMTEMLVHRGPDRTGTWHGGDVALGHTLLATTVEAAKEDQPFRHDGSGCVITADARLDNRDELLAVLGQQPNAGDAQLILAAYLRWGEDCPTRFLGDFAFAIWDPRQRRMFCARDHFGLRTLYYHHTPGGLFAFASSAEAVVRVPAVPRRVNEGRIADFLVQELEGFDLTSTFFEGVFRLPPAHALSITAGGLRLQRYWAPEPTDALRLPSDEAYAEAFLDVFKTAVRCRLRGADRVGVLLSGGIDSASVAAVAAQLLGQVGGSTLPTFSATSFEPSACIETQSIKAAQSMHGLAPHSVHTKQLADFMPALEELTWAQAEPFDCHMTLQRVLYMDARRHGRTAMLDGSGSDIILSAGTRLARLVRRGRVVTAYREAVGEATFHGGIQPAWVTWALSVRQALTPGAVRRLRDFAVGPARLRRAARQRVEQSLISEDFARRIRLEDRLAALRQHGTQGHLVDYHVERAHALTHPYLAVGRERYNRTASASGVESRDPYLDVRLVTFALSLPPDQRTNDGWPKVILRRAMAGQLPEAVRWRKGYQHLGPDFTRALIGLLDRQIRDVLESDAPMLEPYIAMDALHARTYNGSREQAQLRRFQAAALAVWLSRNVQEPLGRTRSGDPDAIQS